jgi:carbonic anhydrase/acetyltransferase-like protein (isoleucine patch superfamily)
MPLYELNKKKPDVGEGTWVAPTAAIIGDVKIGSNCYIGFGAIIRGDLGPIIIGDETAVEDNVVIHTAVYTEIGNRVIIGHLAMIHDATIHNSTLIGIKSTICTDSVIGEHSIIAEQSMVRKNQIIPPGKLYGGSPATAIGDIGQEHREALARGAQVYVDLANQYNTTLKIL